jgi:hypothetical protein
MRVPKEVICVSMVVAVLLSGGCGPKEETNKPRRSNGNAGGATGDNDNTDAPPPRRGDGIAISGLKGTIDAAAVEKALGKKTRSIAACRRKHIGSLSYVGGDVTLFFVIGMDGVPTKVVLEKSQLGHWEMEACILGVAKGLKFVKPEGGKADVRYTMSLANNGTDAKNWDADKAKRTLQKKRRALRACRKGGRPKSFTLTFYVLPGGSVKSVGVVSASALPAGFAECVAKVVVAQTFPDPLGSVARATYEY